MFILFWNSTGLLAPIILSDWLNVKKALLRNRMTCVVELFHGRNVHYMDDPLKGFFCRLENPRQSFNMWQNKINILFSENNIYWSQTVYE
jgi:hypothetical protein